MQAFYYRLLSVKNYRRVPFLEDVSRDLSRTFAVVISFKNWHHVLSKIRSHLFLRLGRAKMKRFNLQVQCSVVNVLISR